MVDEVFKIVQIPRKQGAEIAQDPIRIRFDSGVGGEHTILNDELQEDGELLHDEFDFVCFVDYFGGLDMGGACARVGKDVDECLLAVADDLVDVDPIDVVSLLHSAKYENNIMPIMSNLSTGIISL